MHVIPHQGIIKVFLFTVPTVSKLEGFFKSSWAFCSLRNYCKIDLHVSNNTKNEINMNLGFKLFSFNISLYNIYSYIFHLVGYG